MSATQAGVTGWPVSHSLSPAIFQHWLDRYGIKGSYSRMAVPPDDFDSFFRGLADRGIAGINVTLPFKEKAFTLVDRRSPVADRMGSVNTVTVRNDGMLYGDSSDGEGFLRSLFAAVPHWTPQAGPAVIAGAGGAAKAIADALVQAGAPEVRVANRTLDRARSLADMIAGNLVALPLADIQSAAGDAALLVNATSLGMQGKPQIDFDLNATPDSIVVVDIVYAPLATPLLEKARKANRTAVDGLGMLLHQAVPGFKAWFGRTPEVDDALREAVLAQR